MKLIKYVDGDGKTMQSFIRDDMSQYDADKGIPHNPPDLSELDWHAIEVELHNLLVARGLITLEDVQVQRNLSNAILLVIQPKIEQLYKDKHPKGFRGVVPQMNGNKEAQYG